MNEVAEREVYELIPKEDVEFLIKFDEYKKRAKVIEDQIKAKAEEFLEKNNVNEFRQDGIHIYKTKAYKKQLIDTKRLKDEGVYDLYVKDKWVKGAIRIQVEYDD